MPCDCSGLPRRDAHRASSDFPWTWGLNRSTCPTPCYSSRPTSDRTTLATGTISPGSPPALLFSTSDMNPGREPHRHPPLCYCLHLSKPPPLLHGPVPAPSGLSAACLGDCHSPEELSPLPALPSSATDLPTHNEPVSPCCSSLSPAHKALCDTTQLAQSLEAPLRLPGMQVHDSAAHFCVSPFRQSSTWQEQSRSLLSPSLARGMEQEPVLAGD